MVLDDYLQSRGWEKKGDSLFKGREYFRKRGRSLSEPIDFRLIGKRNILPLKSLNERILAFFSTQGYSIMQPINVINGFGDTFFIGAGLQSFYQTLVNNDIDNKKFVLSQPSIRINSLDKMRNREGYSTSFVNICTEQAAVSVEDHASSLENWLTFLSKVGIYAGDISLVKDPEWNGGEHMNGKSLLIYYGSLQLGDAVFVDAKDSKKRAFTISDIGFGLERINWAINKTRNYFETIGSSYDLFTKGKVPLDLLRSLTLMTLSGIEPSNAGPGYRFKQFVKSYLGHSHDISPLDNIQRNYDFWKGITLPSRSSAEVQDFLLSTFQRQMVLKIKEDLKLDEVKPDFDRFEEFFEFCKSNLPNRVQQIESYLNNSNYRVVT